MLDEDDLSWYAKKADGLRRKVGLPRSLAAEDPRVAGLLAALVRGGIQGSVERRTLYTKRLPPGCRGCLGGKGTNAFVTGLCTRDCFFCFNQKPRMDQLVVHGIPINEPEEAPYIVRRYGLRSVGVSGGEPTLRPERLLRLVKALKGMPLAVRVDLYTNGDRLTDGLLAELKAAGLDALRFNVVARDFDLEPVGRALKVFAETAVEIPVDPAQMARLKEMVCALDGLGVPFLNIHELFVCRENAARVAARGHASAAEESPALQWEPVAGGDAAALELLLFGLKEAKTLSVYYCSTRTQEDISSRGLARRRRLAGPAGR